MGKTNAIKEKQRNTAIHLLTLREEKNLDRRISKSIKCSIKNVYIIQRQSSHPTEVIYLLGQDASIRLPASIFYFKSLGRLSASIFHFMRSLFFLVFFYFLMPAHAFHPFLSITPQHIITPSIEQNPSPPYCSCGLISFPLPSRPIDQLGSSVSSSHPRTSLTGQSNLWLDIKRLNYWLIG